MRGCGEKEATDTSKEQKVQISREYAGRLL
jgi:hypothetical protein